MSQAYGQRLHDFVTQLKSKAQQCQFSVTCQNQHCGKQVSFSQEMVYDQMVIGCYDGDNQVEVLSKASSLVSYQDRYDAMQALELGKKAKNDLTPFALQPRIVLQPETGTVAAQKSTDGHRNDREDVNTPATDIII